MRATDIYSTDFNNYAVGTLSGQQAWIGTGGTWAVSGSVNAPFVPGSVLGPATAPGVDPFGGKGRMVRLVTEKFANGRTKAWLDLANSGKWAAASAGGNSVLEARVKLFVPAGQALASSFGVMISRNTIDVSGGFLVNAQSGAISLLNGGYLPANRVATKITAPLGAWNDFVYRWDTATGEGELLLEGSLVATHVTSSTGGVYAANLLAATDAAPGAQNAFGYFENFAVAAVSPAPACEADLNADGTRDASDLAILLGAWGSAGADLNGDGTTDAQDLAVLLGAWGACN
ncbi:MAG: hypothetical protein ACKOYN_06825 [Planctomycetota bacterium]